MIDQTTTENQPSVTDERIDFSETATRVRGDKETAAGCRGGTAFPPLSRLDVGGTPRQRLRAIRASGTEGVPADPERLSYHEGCSEGSR